MSHFFDLACWIAGERPVEIHVAGACLIEPRFADFGDVDTAMIILRMESEALCHLDFSRRTAYGCDERIEVSGAEGRVESRHPIPVDVALYRGGVIRQRGLHQHWYDRIEDTYPARRSPGCGESGRFAGIGPALTSPPIWPTLARIDIRGGASRDGRANAAWSPRPQP